MNPVDAIIFVAVAVSAWIAGVCCGYWAFAERRKIPRTDRRVHITLTADASQLITELDRAKRACEQTAKAAEKVVAGREEVKP